ncbi:MAG TPA: hypothetical protein VL049_24800 [Candidatus Dormibacteraeota bacterium]|nr:hypothetical protein [Candidatus Dormibacteraeota bacterium]
MRIPSFSTTVFLCCAVVLCRGPVRAQCVGDCAGDGAVTINDLILGVSIALGTAPVSACRAFANAEDEVTISQLILGVNNALDGCPPPVATATATATATAAAATATITATATATAPPPPSATGTVTRTATASRTATVTRSATATRTDTAAATATATATPTATGPTPTSTSPVPCSEDNDCPVGQVCVEDLCVVATPTATATASATTTATSLGTPTATGTGGATATHTATSAPSGTATQSPSATATPSAVATATATAPPSSTASATRTASASATPTATPTRTPTSTPTHTPTVTIPPSSTPLPPGLAVGGRAAFVSSGLGGIQALVGAVAAILKNDGGAALLAQSSGVGGTAGVPPGSVACPINGLTSQTCTKDQDTTVHLTLAADQCVAAGPAGGRAEFNGSITLDSSASMFNSCSPVLFFSAAFATNGLSVQFADAQATPLYSVTADLSGTAGLGLPLDQNCLVGALNLTLGGTLTSSLPNGQAVSVSFIDTTVAMSAITYSANCVPLAYTLTLNGLASFTPMQAAPLAALGGVIADDSFAVTFANFVLEQDASDNPLTVQMTGGLMSDCYGGLVSLETFAPIAVAIGDLCPNAGQLDVTGSGMSMATVVYDDGKVLVTPAGGQQTTYPSCFAPELLMCQPQ